MSNNLTKKLTAQKILNLLEKAYEMCDVVEPMIVEAPISKSLRDTFIGEVIDYLLFLKPEKDTLSNNEVEFIIKITNTTYDYLNNRKAEIDKNFFLPAPVTFHLMVTCDVEVIKKGIVNEYIATRLFYRLYKYLGLLFLIWDSDDDEISKESLEQYNEFMEYLKKKSKEIINDEDFDIELED